MPHASQTVRANRWLFRASAFGLLLGCTPAIVPCRAPSNCGAGQECLAHRCVALGAEPVPPGSARTVVEASRVLVVAADATGDLPPTVTLGGPGAKERALLIGFPQVWASHDVEAAFLLLEPAPGADPSADVVIRVALAGAEWSPGTAPRSPPERAPSSTGLARTRPPSILRIDVTAQVRALRDHLEGDHGFVLRAESAVLRGATYLTGANGGTPRLDVYGRLRGQPTPASAPVQP